MRGEVHILVYCPIDTLQWGSTHSALVQRSIGNEPSVRSNCDCGDAHEENDVPVRL